MRFLFQLNQQQVVNNQQQNQCYHKTDHTLYQINYDQLREGGHGSPDGKNLVGANLPQTVQGNVKNVIGWRGGAERGFLAAYPDCIHVLTNYGTKSMPELCSWYTKVLTHNLSSGVLGQRYGMLVPITYRQLRPTATKEEMQTAHILGWCVELVRAADIVANDTMSLTSKSKQGDYVTWAEKHGLGIRAFNDALLLERGVHTLVRHQFKQDSNVFLEAIAQAQHSRVVGRALSFKLFDTDKKTNRLDGFTMANYKTLVRINVSQTNFCLPVGLALHLAGLSGTNIHEQAHAILHEIGYFVEVTRDFVNCYVDPDGVDIQTGRLTWLITLACQRANQQQRQILEDNYGTDDNQKAQAVKQVYKELNLKKMLRAHIEEKRSDVLSRIQGISKLDKVGLSQEFFFKLMDNMNMNQIS